LHLSKQFSLLRLVRNKRFKSTIQFSKNAPLSRFSAAFRSTLSQRARRNFTSLRSSLSTLPSNFFVGASGFLGGALTIRLFLCQGSSLSSEVFRRLFSSLGRTSGCHFRRGNGKLYGFSRAVQGANRKSLRFFLRATSSPLRALPPTSDAASSPPCFSQKMRCFSQRDTYSSQGNT